MDDKELNLILDNVENEIRKLHGRIDELVIVLTRTRVELKRVKDGLERDAR
jgi:hypothetical protein